MLMQLLKAILARLPIDSDRKRALKDHVYANHGRLFAGTHGYIAWMHARERYPEESPAPPPLAPTDEEWAHLRSRIDERRATPRPTTLNVPVVIPVFRGHDETLACIYSVLHADPASEIIAIDDASDDGALVSKLDELANQGLVTLLRNPRNLGFVATANRGFEHTAGRDVILLNSDTIVYGDWLARIVAVGAADPRIATISPLSNNAEVCSYPSTLRDNPEALEIDYAELDALAARVNAGVAVETPTAVGFCMWVRRACLDEIGGFDAAFGRGYGEENDFCQRAAAKGWVHKIAANVFVRHSGGVSFGAETVALRATALGRVEERHPHYSRDVADFVRRDPLRDARAALDLARLEAAAPVADGKRKFLFITHALGGGIRRHVDDLAEQLESEGHAVYRVAPAADWTEPALSLFRRGLGPTPNLAGFRIPTDLDRFVGALRSLGIDHIHVHSIVGYPASFTAALPAIAKDLAAAYDITTHDYHAICPRANLLGTEDRYCGEPEAAGCARCLRKLGSASGRPAIESWRGDWGRLLVGARNVYCPSHDTLARLQSYFPEPNFVYRPHPEKPNTPAGVSRSHRDSPSHEPGVSTAQPTMRVVVIGELGRHKGSRVLLAIAGDAATRDLPIEFVLVGYSDCDDALERTGRVQLMGPYVDDDLQRILAGARAALALFPSTVPETYGYTLSAAWRAKMMPVVFDFGALAERVREVGDGVVLSTDLQRSPSRLNDELMRIARGPQNAAPRPRTTWTPVTYPSLAEDYYGGL